MITGIKHVNLKSEGTLSGLKGYIAVTASICYSEEITSKGRVRASLSVNRLLLRSKKAILVTIRKMRCFSQYHHVDVFTFDFMSADHHL